MGKISDSGNNGFANVFDADATPVLTGKKALAVYDVNSGGAPNATEAAAIGTTGSPSMGKDPAGNAQFLKTETDGSLRIHGSGTVGAASPGAGVLILGTDDTFLRAVRVRDNGAMRVESIPYLWQIADGHVPNHSGIQRHSSVTVAATDRTLLVGGVWSEQTVGAQRSIKSDSVNDTSGGSGVRKIQIKYISSVDGLEKSEVIALNGTTAVNTVATDIKFITKLKAVDVGSVGFADGTVSMMTAVSGGGVVMAEILAGKLELLSSVIYVPTGKSLFVSRVEMTTNDEAVYQFQITEDLTSLGGGANVPDIEFGAHIRKEGGFADLATPIKVCGGQKFEVYVSPEGAGNTFHVNIYGWIE